jgi:hypothetical protein
MRIQSVFILLALPMVVAMNAIIFPSLSQNGTSYSLLEKDLSAIAETDSSICIAHSADGFANMMSGDMDACNKVCLS